MRRSSWILALAALAVAATPALAQLDARARRCADRSPDKAIAACTEIIEGGAATGTRIVEGRRLAVAYTLRGAAYSRKHDTDRALKDFDSAVKANPAYAAAFANRGNLYNVRGEYDRAIADFTRAIALDARFARAYANRGSAYFEKQDDARAIADYDRALALAPLPRTLRNRGNVLFVLGRYAEAARDFRRALALDPSDPYGVVWLRIAQSHAGGMSREALAARAAKVNTAAWPGPVIAFYLGARTAAQVRAAARGDPGQACEAAYYIGEAAATGGDPAAARALFQEAAATCPHAFVEYRSAVAALKRAP